LSAGYDDFTAAQRSAVEAAYPRQPQFAEGFLQALYDSLKHRPETTQGTGLPMQWLTRTLLSVAGISAV
jgi:hypothetical protein